VFPTDGLEMKLNGLRLQLVSLEFAQKAAKYLPIRCIIWATLPERFVGRFHN
jgi:hypothetical protein